MPDGLVELQRELDTAGEAVARLAEDVDRLRRRVGRLAVLRTGAPDEAAQLRALESVLDFERVVRHVEGACAAAEQPAGPVPHVVVSNLFPADVHAAIVEAIPEPVFFEAVADGAYELGIPPRLAPFHVMVTWEFVKTVVLRALSPALIVRLHQPLAAFAQTRFPALPPFDDWNVEVTLSRGRLVRRAAGYTGVANEDRPWDLLTTVVCVGGSQEDRSYGSVLDGRSVPFRSNGALAFVGPAALHEYASIPLAAPQQASRHTYEFGIGPTRDGRRVLNAMMESRSAATQT